MFEKVPLSELEQRLKKFREIMDKKEPEWGLALVAGKVNQYYFTGTMQDGLLFIPRDREAIYYVRRSYERALEESFFPDIRIMSTFRDAASDIGKLPSTVYLEAETIPLAMYGRLAKHFNFTGFKSMDASISRVRSVKSRYELDLIAKAGAIHKRVLENRVPQLLAEGMSEKELTAAVYSVMLEEGHHGASRFNMFDTEMPLGHVAFGESSLYPTYFNGPGGNYGLGPYAPHMGSQKRRLTDGDLVFIDTGCGFKGYHSDKTMTYVFGKPLPEHAEECHRKCLDIQKWASEMLKPGIKPSLIYRSIMERLDDQFLKNFMGYKSRKVKFIGHGIGLQVDEFPVLAEGFDEPLQEGMVMALEPKAGVEGVGMVGIENTFLVSADGGVLITGNHPGLLKVGAGQ